MISGFIGRVGSTELIVILMILLVVVGPTQLPKLSRSFGETIGGFKKGLEKGLGEETNSKKQEEAMPETAAPEAMTVEAEREQKINV